MNQVMLHGINPGRCNIRVVKQIGIGIEIRGNSRGRNDVVRRHRPSGLGACCDQLFDKLQQKHDIFRQDHKIRISPVSYLSRQFLIVRKILVDEGNGTCKAVENTLVLIAIIVRHSFWPVRALRGAKERRGQIPVA